MVIAAQTPKRNTYELRYQDLIWIENHKNDKPLTFIRGILKRRFNYYTSRFKTQRSFAEACLKINKANLWYFKNHKTDHEAIEKLSSLRKSKPDLIIESFRDLWRGYTEADVVQAQNGLDRDKQRFLKILERMINKNRTKIGLLDRKRKQITKERLYRNRDELNEIGKLINRVFNDPVLVAQSKLYYLTIQRRNPSLFNNFLLPNDYLQLERKIKAHDPMKLLFPLRFLYHIPAKMYDTFELKWRKGASRDELILSFDDPDSDDKSFFENLRLHSSELFEKLNINRTSQIDELEKTYSGSCFTATALLAVTLTEGVIWDFACYLTKKRLRIFRETKGKYHPYEWDHKNKKYKHLNGNVPVANHKFELTSARSLLKNTRLGSIIQESLYTYLIDEFYDDRNKLTHGNFANRNVKVDAIAALLCLYTIVHDINSYLNSRRIKRLIKLKNDN